MAFSSPTIRKTMKTSILAAIVALSLASADAANLRQLAGKHASSPMPGRMEAHKTAVARMEAHKTSQTKMESQFNLPLNLGKLFAPKSTQQRVTTAPPATATDVEATDEPISLTEPDEQTHIEELERPQRLGSYPRPSQYAPTYVVIVNNDYP